MKKQSLIGLLAVVFLLGTVSGALIVVSLWQTSMSMTLVPYAEDDFHIELWDEYGSPLSSHNWGEFKAGETKSLNCTVMYLGAIPGNITWNATDLPSGWSIAVWVWPNPVVPDGMWWPENWGGTIEPGAYVDIRIDLTETGAIENTPYSFTLNWMAGPP